MEYIIGIALIPLFLAGVGYLFSLVIGILGLIYIGLEKLFKGDK